MHLSLQRVVMGIRPGEGKQDAAETGIRHKAIEWYSIRSRLGCGQACQLRLRWKIGLLRKALPAVLVSYGGDFVERKAGGLWRRNLAARLLFR
jgi:hypothetical protein